MAKRSSPVTPATALADVAPVESGNADRLAGADDELIVALRMGVLRLSRRLRLETTTEDLNITQINVLAMLSSIGPLSPGELATAERVRPPSMTRAINALEEGGLVVKAPHLTDGRQVVVEVTAAGLALLEEGRAIRNAWLRDHLQTCSDEELATLAAAAPLLQRLAQS